MSEQVREIAISELHGFEDHPFQVKDDESFQELCDSIQKYGILSPLLARPTEDGYEIVSGHRRKAAALSLGMDRLPVLVRDMTDDEAVILMVDSNIQRENLLPSEKAFAYKMKYEALKHQGKATSCQVGTKLRTDAYIASQTDESARNIQRYIRLTYLAKPILDLVDEQRIAFSPAVELSYLTKQEQAELWDIMQSEDCTPSLSQAVRMKKLSQIVQLTPERIFDIMSEEKANQKERVRLEVSAIRKYFPRSYTPEQMEQSILKMLDEQYKRRQRNRDAR
ncbi:MAG: ParB/RepB/Spo0J family partition protein [Eubacteriales bacterium]|nr:ParB/RepB/Spo0J family partition protein [Eubacteriales bacterium]